jgi:hypothetical protein
MLYAGLDLSRKHLDFHLLDAEGATVDVGASPPDADGLRSLSERFAHHREPIRAAIESMNGARFVHDRLELHGRQVEIADAQKHARPPAARTTRPAGAVAGNSRRQPATDRRARARDFLLPRSTRKSTSFARRAALSTRNRSRRRKWLESG